MAVKTYRGTGMASAESSEASPEAGNVERTKQETPTESSQASGESEQHNQPQQGMLPASSKASPLLCGEFVHSG